jgi:hypothetical protein
MTTFQIFLLIVAGIGGYMAIQGGLFGPGLDRNGEGRLYWGLVMFAISALAFATWGDSQWAWIALILGLVAAGIAAWLPARGGWDAVLTTIVVLILIFFVGGRFFGKDVTGWVAEKAGNQISQSVATPAAPAAPAAAAPAPAPVAVPVVAPAAAAPAPAPAATPDTVCHNVVYGSMALGDILSGEKADGGDVWVKCENGSVITEVKPVDSRCPTDGEMQVLIFDANIKPVFTAAPWEPCKWNWQSNDLNTITFELPVNWQATVTLRDQSVVVYYGPETITAMGFSLRYLPNYEATQAWALDKCQLLKKEYEFGIGRDPAYETTAGNFSCN